MSIALNIYMYIDIIVIIHLQLRYSQRGKWKREVQVKNKYRLYKSEEQFGAGFFKVARLLTSSVRRK